MKFDKELLAMLGHSAKHKIADLEGVVTGVSISCHDMPRIGIHSHKLSDKGQTIITYVDKEHVVVQTTQPRKIDVIKADKSAFKFFDIVVDKASGATGIITSCGIWANGCIRYGIQPQERKDGAPVEEFWQSQNMLELVKAGKEPKEEKKKPGGPERRIPEPSQPR